MLDEKKIALLEEMAACRFSLKQIATALQVDYLELKAEIYKDTLEATAYDRGKLLQELKLRKAIFKAATDGSGPAQALALKIIEDSKLDAL